MFDVGAATMLHQVGKVLSVGVSVEKKYLRVLQIPALEIKEQAKRVFLSPEQKSMTSSMISWGIPGRPGGAMRVIVQVNALGPENGRVGCVEVSITRLAVREVHVCSAEVVDHLSWKPGLEVTRRNEIHRFLVQVLLRW